jgi:hypothetical protein
MCLFENRLRVRKPTSQSTAPARIRDRADVSVPSAYLLKRRDA